MHSHKHGKVTVGVPLGSLMRKPVKQWLSLCKKTLASSLPRLFPMDCGTLALVFFVGSFVKASDAKSEGTVDATCVHLRPPWNAYCRLRPSRYHYRRDQ